ncbi:hypothetical protein [uncultured Friedmanniella sp.]|uniref:hypothetical protein n=1 Tax=uncultured Friedmanniella sp. TaxID=335381 RepID=UPI0035CB5BA5
MTTSTARLDAAPAVRAPFSRANKAGLVIAALLGLSDVISLASPTPSGEVGPPTAILALDAVLGLITVVAVVVAWRSRSRGLVRLAAGARILSLITALPAFFAGVAPALVALVAGFTVVTVAAVVLMLLPPRRPADD